MTYFFLNQNRVSFVYPWRQTAVKALVTFLLVGPDNYSEPGSSSQKTRVEICAAERTHETSFPSQSPFPVSRFYMLLNLKH